MSFFLSMLRWKAPGHKPLHCVLSRMSASAFASLCFLWLLASPSLAGEPQFKDGIYPYSVVEQDLASLLKEFGQNTGVRIKVDHKINQIVKGRLAQKSAREFLDFLCHAYGLDWYYDGLTLHVTSSSDRETRMLPLGKFTLAQLNEGLQKLNFQDPRYVLKPAVGGEAVLVSGPPRFVELVQKTLSALPHPERVQMIQVAQVSEGEAPDKTIVYRAENQSVVDFNDEDNRVSAKKSKVR